MSWRTGLQIAPLERMRWFALCILGWLLASCFPPKAKPQLSTRHGVRARPAMVAVVVALDGVRWEEVFLGTEPSRLRSRPHVDAHELMPNLHRIMRHHGCALGAPESGFPLSASGPNFVSLPGYTEMFTGAPPFDCPDNRCDRVELPTLADDAALLQEGLGGVAVITSWPKIELAAASRPDGVVLSTGRSGGRNLGLLQHHPETLRAYERGLHAAAAPGWGDFRPDRYTAELARSYMEHFQPRFLFVGLGEPDEYAHQGKYERYLESLQDADATIGRLHEQLKRAEERGSSTLLFVTTDHGRQEFRHHGARYPESARSWLVAAGSVISARGKVMSPQPRKLADLAPTIRLLWGLEADARFARSSLPSSGRVLTELFIEL